MSDTFRRATSVSTATMIIIIVATIITTSVVNNILAGIRADQGQMERDKLSNKLTVQHTNATNTVIDHLRNALDNQHEIMNKLDIIINQTASPPPIS